MKKLVITIGLLAGATVGYSQGTINWTDFVSPAGSDPGFSITIFGPGAETVGTSGQINNTSIDLPAGNATYAGAPLSGTGFTVGLYVDSTPDAVAADVLSGTPIATSTFQTGGNAGTWFTGSSLTAVDPTGAAGSLVYVELAAWSGSLASYAAAVTAGGAEEFGHDLASTGQVVLGGGSPPATPGALDGVTPANPNGTTPIGLDDFALVTSTVPEPGTIALGVMGASAFLMRLRRKQ